MGCDIHLHTEVKINGKWRHYAQKDVDRCYAVFAKMADVRNNERNHEFYIKPISEPKGLPGDLSFLTEFAYKKDIPDAHSESWLNADEIVELVEWINSDERLRWFKPYKEFGYLFGNNWHCFNQYRSDYPSEIEDIRFVFWFDN